VHLTEDDNRLAKLIFVYNSEIAMIVSHQYCGMSDGNEI